MDFASIENFNMTAEQCKHDIFGSDNACIECGYLMNSETIVDGISQRNVRAKVVAKSIVKRLEPYPIPDNIKYEAQRIFDAVNEVNKKSKSNKKELFFYTYSAYRNLQISCDPTELAALFQIKPKAISRILTTFHNMQPDCQVKLYQSTANDFVGGYAERLQFSEELIEDVKKFVLNIYAICPDLYDLSPQNVAAAILMFYCKIRGITFDKKNYMQNVVNKSDVTINGVYKIICTAYNSSCSSQESSSTQ